MKKRILIPLLILAAVIIAIIIYSLVPNGESAVQLTTKVEKGNFEVVVAVTGELRAQNSTEIRGPSELRSQNLRIRSIKIQNLIPEGTVVDSGDWVATLDRSEADNSLKDISDELEKDESQFLKTQLDTTIQLRQLRNDLINLKFNMEEMEIALEQSKFEPPATIRQATINLDKATRAYEQAENNYALKVAQSKANMTEVGINLTKQKRRKMEMESVLKNFDIKAPSSGMVIYHREWNGQKRTVGSEINTWDLTVAELPDLSTLASRTYVNEIDISKLKVGQKVKIGVDAFPDKSYTGVVSEVANIGEQLPNADAKVFEVNINIYERDPILRPSMTTSNKIVTKEFPDVLFIPLETVHSNDSLTYVYTRKGNKKVVVLGESNENSIIVEQGLSEGEEILISVPEEPEKYSYSGLELMQIIKERKAEEAKKMEEMKDNSKKREKKPSANAKQNFNPQGRRQGK
ncbi:MAG: HlyD family efflux transporter periplasmic adaptor subunit [Bacteroidales bacterium]|nr:HlyD family efflux transporter periplasmic adaptor subunit [Bacteroidales bacterium]MCB9013561.1 HlyD family efflux transporter periplasmic adaptor subunit [Bacteroidales bacterium]